MTSHKHIELDRHFNAFDRKLDRDQRAAQSYATPFDGAGNKQNWADLLNHRLVVVLAEGRSGKSKEFEERTRLLNESGESAFYLPLRDLVDQPTLRFSLSEDQARFQQWLSSNKKGYFFLDSVDESRLKNPGDFVRALDTFRGAFKAETIQRLRLFLSSRGSDWDSDLFEPAIVQRFATMNRAAATAAAGSEEADRLLVVTMEPLNKEQVATYLQGLGYTDGSGFCDALTRHHAWPFARRPIDVENLYRFWQQRKRLGTLTELMAYSVDDGLREAEAKRPDSMPRDRLRQGARSLAAASVLCRIRAFRTGQSSALSDSSTLSPADCLPADWSPEERRALLTRPLFTDESYSQLRFHDHRIAEFLTAEWLVSILSESHLPYLEGLLTCRVDGRRQLRPSLVAVTAWLGTAESPFKADVRAWILEAEPGLYFVHGDAEIHDAAYRRQLLAALIARYAGRSYARFDYAAESASRIVNGDLADDISGYLADKTVAESLRQELLMLVRYGRLNACLPATLQVLNDPLESGTIKNYAAIVLRDLDDPAATKQFAEWALGIESLTGFLAETVIEAAFPAVFDTSDLITILRKTAHVWGRYSSGFPWALGRHLGKMLTTQSAEQVLAPMLDMLTEAPYITINDKAGPAGRKFLWISELLPTVLAHVLQAPSFDDVTLAYIVRALRMLDILSGIGPPLNDAETPMQAGSLNHSQLRREYFWERLRSYRERRGHEPFHLSAQIENHVVLHAHRSDIEWLLRDIREAPEQQDRKLAADLAWRMSLMASSAFLVRVRIWACARREPALGYSLLSIAGRSAKDWLLGYWYRNQHKPIFRKFWWQRQFNQFKNRLRERWYLLTHLRDLRTGIAERDICLLCQRGVGDRMRRWHSNAWSALQASEGRPVMRAVQQGCMAAWPKFRPLLPHEELVPGNSDGRFVFGLAGIALQAERDPEFFASLDANAAELAVRYALCEINGFPDWWLELVLHQPLAVRRVLIECIRAEWHYGPERLLVSDVMSALASRGAEIIPLVLPAVEAQLEFADPLNAEILRYALIILMSQPGLNRVWLGGIAARRVGIYPDDSSPRHMWLAVWLQCDASAALDYFEAVLRATADPEQLTIKLCAALRGERLGRVPPLPNPAYLGVANAKRFVMLIFRFVSPDADIDRAGQGAYTPNSRDDAQSFRESLLPQLEASPDHAATNVLKELANEPVPAAHRDYVLGLIDARNRRSADSDPWQPDDIRQFPKRREVSPKSNRGLFEMACRHLEHIGRTVETDDKAWHRDIADDADEKRIEQWLKDKLLQVNAGLYAAPRNPEKDGLDRPDFLLEVPGIATLPVELKRADSEHWTYQKLVDGLEKQLVGKYLRAPESQFGIYVLATLRAKRWEDPDKKGRMMEFDELVARIRQNAADIKRTNPGVRDLAVATIDFRTRA